MLCGQVKVSLPTQLTERHHLFFTFYHVTCDLAKVQSSAKSSNRKSVYSFDSIVGYAWFPLLVNGRVNIGEQNIRVAGVPLPVGYLGLDSSTIGKVCSTLNDVRFFVMLER